MGIRIITDSTADFDRSEAALLDIGIVCLKTVFGNEVYRDGIDLDADQFYTKLASSETLPTTSQPSPAEFAVEYQKARPEDQIIVICMSRLLSGTYQSAEIAKAGFSVKIHVIDSCTTTVSLQLLVRRAVDLRDQGCTAQEIVSIIEREKNAVHLIAAIDTLEYLQRGGRLSKTSAITGTLLNVKPLILLHDGVISVTGKCLGMKKAFAAIFNKARMLGDIDYSKPLAIGFTANHARFSLFEKHCQRELAGHSFLKAHVGSVVGTHAGPGAVALAFFSQTSA